MLRNCSAHHALFVYLQCPPATLQHTHDKIWTETPAPPSLTCSVCCSKALRRLLMLSRARSRSRKLQDTWGRWEGDMSVVQGTTRDE
jgi:hypothetical protein